MQVLVSHFAFLAACFRTWRKFSDSSKCGRGNCSLCPISPLTGDLHACSCH